MENKIRQIIKEELTKQEVNTMINDKLSSYMKQRDMENKVKDIVADVMERFFRMMYNKRGFWKNDIKNG